MLPIPTLVQMIFLSMCHLFWESYAEIQSQIANGDTYTAYVITKVSIMKQRLVDTLSQSSIKWMRFLWWQLWLMGFIWIRETINKLSTSKKANAIVISDNHQG